MKTLTLMKKMKTQNQDKYKVNEDDEVESAEITKTAAKISGENCQWWNIRNLSGNE